MHIYRLLFSLLPDFSTRITFGSGFACIPLPLIEPLKIGIIDDCKLPLRKRNCSGHGKALRVDVPSLRRQWQGQVSFYYGGRCAPIWSCVDRPLNTNALAHHYLRIHILPQPLCFVKSLIREELTPIVFFH